MQIKNMETNAIYEGDNLEIMSKFPDKSVDLVYIDPPFFTNRHFEIIWKDGAEKRAFQDRWEGGIEHYITWMEPRLRECYRLLKDTGTMYLHCDWHASAHLRIQMDKIFGDKNFINEIIWKRHTVHSDTKQGAKHLGRIHDVILVYSKSKNYIWNPHYEKYTKEYTDSAYNKTDKTGKPFKTSDLSAAKPGGETDYEWKGHRPPKGRYWAYSKANMEKFEKEGRIYYSDSGKPYMKQYLDEMPGVMLQDIWDDLKFEGANESMGYPTQKPVALLERIIKLSTDKSGLVFDAFCGCGTALVAAQRLGRRWVGIDVSPTACKLMQKRLRKLFSIDAKIVRGEVDLNYVKKLAPFEFQNWVVVDKFLGRVSPTKSRDMGIDGLTPQVTGGFPIQVKQSPDVGRNVVDNFETAIRRMGKKKGYIVAYSFGKGAYEEVARVKNQEGLDITLRTVEELLDGKVE